MDKFTVLIIGFGLGFLTSGIAVAYTIEGHMDMVHDIAFDTGVNAAIGTLIKLSEQRKDTEQ